MKGPNPIPPRAVNANIDIGSPRLINVVRHQLLEASTGVNQ